MTARTFLSNGLNNLRAIFLGLDPTESDLDHNSSDYLYKRLSRRQSILRRTQVLRRISLVGAVILIVYSTTFYTVRVFGTARSVSE